MKIKEREDDPVKMNNVLQLPNFTLFPKPSFVSIAVSRNQNQLANEISEKPTTAALNDSKHFIRANQITKV